MDITLPQGITVGKNGEELRVNMVKSTSGLYPFISEEDDDGNISNTYKHTLLASIRDNGNIAVVCNSNANADFLKTSGNLFRVFIQASPYAKPGANEVKMTGLNLTTSAAVKYVPEGDLNTGTITVGTAASAAISISDTNQWGTFLSPFDLATLPEGLKAYTVSAVTSTTVTLTEVTSLTAYTPYILYAPAGYSGTLTGTLDASKYPASTTVTSGNLVGLLTQQEVSSGYILQNQGSGVAFHPVASGTPFVLNAGRCYLASEVSGTRSLNINFDNDGTTGISEVNTATTENEQFYDLQGNKVTTLKPGKVYISNKRKVFINK